MVPPEPHKRYEHLGMTGVDIGEKSYCRTILRVITTGRLSRPADGVTSLGRGAGYELTLTLLLGGHGLDVWQK